MPNTYYLYIKDSEGNYRTAGIQDVCLWWNTVYSEDIFLGDSFNPQLSDIEKAWKRSFPLPKKLTSKELQKRNTPFAPEIRGVRFLLNILSRML